MVKATNTEMQSLDTYSQNLPAYMDATHVTPEYIYIYAGMSIQLLQGCQHVYTCRDVNPTPAGYEYLTLGMSIQLPEGTKYEYLALGMSIQLPEGTKYEYLTLGMSIQLPGGTGDDSLFFIG